VHTGTAHKPPTATTFLQLSTECQRPLETASLCCLTISGVPGPGGGSTEGPGGVVGPSGCPGWRPWNASCRQGRGRREHSHVNCRVGQTLPWEEMGGSIQDKRGTCQVACSARHLDSRKFQRCTYTALTLQVRLTVPNKAHLAMKCLSIRWTPQVWDNLTHLGHSCHTPPQAIHRQWRHHLPCIMSTRSCASTGVGSRV
jgi:hypothetical protein